MGVFNMVMYIYFIRLIIQRKKIFKKMIEKMEQVFKGSFKIVFDFIGFGKYQDGFLIYQYVVVWNW